MLRKRPEVYTSELAQKQWNASAEAYAEFQAFGDDFSDEMIRIAREHTSSYDIEYQVLDAAKVAEYFNPEMFDLATACVSLQDMPNPADVIAAVNYVLRSGSRFVFCGTHPCTDTPYRRWVRDNSGNTQRYLIGLLGVSMLAL
jgi:ubiquinone/menaquinone biosynthesis C-methylase UbiE